MQLRFIIRDNKRILQYFDSAHQVHGWQDVPLVEEPRKAKEWWIVEHGSLNEVYTVSKEMPGIMSNSSKLYRVREILDGEK